MASEYFIGVDSGTQGTRAVIVDGGSGEVVDKASVGYGLIEGLPEGHMEQHPSIWTEAMMTAIESALKTEMSAQSGSRGSSTDSCPWTRRAR